MIKLEQLSVVRGWPVTRETLAHWREQPIAAVRAWLLLAFGIALLLLGLVLLVATHSPPSPNTSEVSHLFDSDQGPWQARAGALFRNNMLVLALHAVACFAGFVVYIALREPIGDVHPLLDRWSRSLAILASAFIPVATALSITTQAWVLGARTSTMAAYARLSPFRILETTARHSVLELTAVFLPLAASLVLIVRRRPERLLAATLVTVAIAVPAIGLAAVVEARTWSGILRSAVASRGSTEGDYLGTMVSDIEDVTGAQTWLSLGTPLDDAHHDQLQDAIGVAVASDAEVAVVVHDQHGYSAFEVAARVIPKPCGAAGTTGGQVAVPLTVARFMQLYWHPIGPVPTKADVFVVDGKLVQPADRAAPPPQQEVSKPCPA